MQIKIIHRACSLLIFLCFFALCGRAQNNETYALTADSLQEGKVVELDKLSWKYHAGDDAAWATPEFDDGNWKRLTNDEINSNPAATLENWNVRAWFRLQVAVDERLVNKPLTWRMWHWGASEIYIDGKLIQSFGVIEPNGDVEFNPRGVFFPVVFTSGGKHTIAVRYSFKAASDLTQGYGGWLTRGYYLPGFRLVVEPGENAALRFENRARGERLDYVFIGLLSALALVHFLLFVFYRRARGNLFYSFFVFGLAATFWLSSLTNTNHFGAIVTLLSDVVRQDVQSLAVISLLAFLYVEFVNRPSRFFWILLFLWLFSLVLHAAQVYRGFPFVLLMLAITLADSLRIMWHALVERRDGAWIIAAGIGLFVFGVANNVATEQHIIEITEWLYQLNLYSTVLSVPLAVSIYLARNFARTNQNLEAQLTQVQELSAQQLEYERTEAELRLAHERTQAENERRAKELEEARQLQLSMLPKKVPQFPNLEIAAYMKPATEVGGDYYDFYVGDDGTLTVAFGDATGHGRKAGSVVTATKSLFNAFAGTENIPQIFKQISQALKRMNLRGLFMAMTMLKIKNNNLTVGVAGMPSVLIYRSETKQVEEILIRAMPLGSVANFPYKEQKFNLSVGDCIVVMSDGFPEMFNVENEMIGFEKAAEILPEVAAKSPQEIINYFVEVSEAWAGSRPQDDDVTFVVLKVVR
ncbi:hypothetical protein BH18ACI1_BH18ACI1_13320 [soil metagenome]